MINPTGSSAVSEPVQAPKRVKTSLINIAFPSKGLAVGTGGVWTPQERQAFLDVFFAFDISLGRWNLFHKKANLGRSLQELKFFAINLLQHCLKVADEKTRRIFQATLSYVCSETINHKDCPPDPSFADPVFSKLVQTQILPWARRIRLLQRLTEVLSPLTDLNTLALPSIEGQLTTWWNTTCDVHLLIGLQKHGLGYAHELW